MMDAARKRAQRRALYLAKRRGDPLQSIQVVGFPSRTYRDDGLYQATQDQQGLLVFSALAFVLHSHALFANYVVSFVSNYSDTFDELVFFLDVAGPLV